ncbi:MAG: hypothetical protein SFT81_05740 [Candidatus Caenarcaniphilales bacterium]|nr:hypothetical protein [Candidatus Caenarcaniphilales bacterium]
MPSLAKFKEAPRLTERQYLEMTGLYEKRHPIKLWRNSSGRSASIWQKAFGGMRANQATNQGSIKQSILDRLRKRKDEDQSYGGTMSILRD